MLTGKQFFINECRAKVPFGSSFRFVTTLILSQIYVRNVIHNEPTKNILFGRCIWVDVFIIHFLVSGARPVHFASAWFLHIFLFASCFTSRWVLSRPHRSLLSVVFPSLNIFSSMRFWVIVEIFEFSSVLFSAFSPIFSNSKFVRSMVRILFDISGILT